MGHYAKVGIRPAYIFVNDVQTQIQGGLVDQVIVAEADFFATFVDSSPGQWIQTSYNTIANQHTQGGTPLRGNYAGINYIYDLINDVFYEPQPYASWILDKTTWTWKAPVEAPTDGNFYKWQESSKSWVKA